MSLINHRTLQAIIKCRIEKYQAWQWPVPRERNIAEAGALFDGHRRSDVASVESDLNARGIGEAAEKVMSPWSACRVTAALTRPESRRQNQRAFSTRVGDKASQKSCPKCHQKKQPSAEGATAAWAAGAIASNPASHIMICEIVNIGSGSYNVEWR